MREKLADLCHRQWSGWMEYLFGKCAFNPNDGTATIPKWAVDRWQRQLSTDYAHLSEEEKNADRDEADRFLSLIAESHPQADNPGSPKLFLLQVQDAIECDRCSDADKVAAVKLLVSEQLRAGA